MLVKEKGEKGDVQCSEPRVNSTTPVRSQNDHTALWFLDSIEDGTGLDLDMISFDHVGEKPLEVSLETLNMG